MPIRQTALPERTLSNYRNHSFEFKLLAWLLSGGWEASMPSVDLGAKTDVQVLDGRKLYRIQVKTLQSSDENIKVNNQWEDVDIDYVVYFSHTAPWGYIVPAFKERSVVLKNSGIRFYQHPKNFLKAFERI